MRKQRGGGNCCGKSKSNRVKPILYPGIIEFTEVEVINQPSVSSDEESLKPESVILDMQDIPNYIPSRSMSIDNNKLTVTTYDHDHDHETTFETMPDDMIRVINTYLLPEFSSTDCTFNTNLMITSKNMNKILKESNENNISTAVNKYFNCPEFTALFEFFKTGEGWCELCVYPIVIFNNNTCKTFEFHINVENKKINIYHFPHTLLPAPKKTSDVEKLIYEMNSCLKHIIGSEESFKSIHFVTWAGDFSYNEDDDEDDNTPVYDDDDINEINATVKYNPEQISTKNIKIYSAVKLAFSKMINMINDQYTYTYLASLSLPHIMYMYSSLYTDDNKITLFKIDPENRGGARRRKLKLRMRS